MFGYPLGRRSQVRLNTLDGYVRKGELYDWAGTVVLPFICHRPGTALAAPSSRPEREVEYHGRSHGEAVNMDCGIGEACGKT